MWIHIYIFNNILLQIFNECHTIFFYIFVHFSIFPYLSLTWAKPDRKNDQARASELVFFFIKTTAAKPKTDRQPAFGLHNLKIIFQRKTDLRNSCPGPTIVSTLHWNVSRSKIEKYIFMIEDSYISQPPD
jgi:hypothetical protein